MHCTPFFGVQCFLRISVIHFSFFVLTGKVEYSEHQNFFHVLPLEQFSFHHQTRYLYELFCNSSVYSFFRLPLFSSVNTIRVSESDTLDGFYQVEPAEHPPDYIFLFIALFILLQQWRYEITPRLIGSFAFYGESRFLA